MFLEKILEQKKISVERAKNSFPLEALKKSIENYPPAADFKGANLRSNFRETLLKNKGRALIAEIKRASPSKGLIRMEEEPEKRALVYQENGAAAVSVLTEENFFLGSLEDLKRVKSMVGIPVLRKDFIIDEYQIYETCCCGADAVLLITSILTNRELAEFIELARRLNLSALVEVYNREELLRALACGAEIIGINNRNLNTFKTNLKVTLDLCSEVPPGIVLVSESGLKSHEDLKVLRENGVHAFLIGEALMNHPSPGNKIKELLGHGKN